jgi:hypothetical protein
MPPPGVSAVSLVQVRCTCHRLLLELPAGHVAVTNHPEHRGAFVQLEGVLAVCGKCGKLVAIEIQKECDDA